MSGNTSGHRQRAVMASDTEWEIIGRVAKRRSMDRSRYLIYRALMPDALPTEVLRRAVRELNRTTFQPRMRDGGLQAIRWSGVPQRCAPKAPTTWFLSKTPATSSCCGPKKLPWMEPPSKVPSRAARSSHAMSAIDRPLFRSLMLENVTSTNMSPAWESSAATAASPCTTLLTAELSMSLLRPTMTPLQENVPTLGFVPAALPTAEL